MIKRLLLPLILGLASANLLWFSWSYVGVIEGVITTGTAVMGVLAAFCAGAYASGAGD